MNATEIDMTPFCDATIERLALGAPFVRGGVRYATNGIILIAVPADGEPDTETPKKVPDCTKILKDYPASADWKPWPEPEFQMRMQPCRKCNGSGAAHMKECTECNGAGETECCECGQDIECRECQGRGEIRCGKCSLCNGSKRAEQPAWIDLGRYAVSWELDQKIRTLPSPQFVCGEGGKVFLRFDGGRGLAMSMDVPEKRDRK